MARFMVYVPDELHEKAQDWKEQLNFSELFRRALSEKIQLLEQIQEDAEDLEARISVEERSKMLERFKQEKLELELHSFRRGFNWGITWAKNARYRQLIMCSGVSPTWENLPPEERDAAIDTLLYVDTEDGVDPQLFVDGWFRAVQVFVKWVDDQLPHRT